MAGAWLIPAALLAVGSITDFRSRTVPDWVPVGIAGGALLGHLRWPESLCGAALGFLVFMVVAAVVKGGVGGADVKVSAALGLWCGPAVLYVIGLASLAALVVCAVTRSRTVPFVPYLAGAFALYMAAAAFF